MNYYYNLVDSIKKKVIAPSYLFYGSEDFLKNRVLSLLKTQLLGIDQSEFNYEVFESKEVLAANVVSAAQTLPFAGDKRIVVVKDVFIDKDAPEKVGPLLEYLLNTIDTTCLVMLFTGPLKPSKALCKAVIKGGGLVTEFKTLNRKELLSWLVLEAKEKGRKINGPVCAEMVMRVGNSLALLDLELNKLYIYTLGKDQITLQDVIAVVPQGAESRVFDIIDALVEGSYRTFLDGIKELLNRREDPQSILGLLARQFHMILLTCALKEEDSTDSVVTEQLKVHPFVAKKVILQSKRFTEKKAGFALECLLKIDVDIKSGKRVFFSAMEWFVSELLAYK